MTGIGPVDRIVGRQSLTQWEAPYDREPVSPTKQAEILQKVESYFTERCVSYLVE